MRNIRAELQKRSSYSFDDIVTYLNYQDQVFTRQLAILGTPVRVFILRAVAQMDLISDREISLEEIAGSLNLPSEAIAGHLNWLERQNFIVAEGERFRLGTLTLEQVFPEIEHSMNQIRLMLNEHQEPSVNWNDSAPSYADKSPKKSPKETAWVKNP